MTDEEVLSQEEIDALLNSVDDSDGENDNAALGESLSADASNNGIDDIEKIDFSNQERIVKGQLPVLERIYDRFSNMLAEATYELMSRDMKIDQENLRIMKFTEFMSSLSNPCAINTVRLHPLRGKAMLIFDNQFIFSLVEHYFGGRGQFSRNVEGRDFTLTEIRVNEIFLDVFINKYVKSWSPIEKLNAEKLGLETNPQLVNSSSSSDVMLINQFNVSFEADDGKFYIVLPYPMIEPIREKLELGASHSDDETDPNWLTGLRNEILNVPLVISSNIATSKMNLGAVNRLKKGDFIPIEMRETVTLDVEGVPTFTARVGTSNEKCAVKIIEKIKY